MTNLSIPDIADDADTLTAALAYAKAGWYILPAKAGTKDPGKIVGKGWPAKSSRDAKQITAWFAGTDHGIALHAGRSGAVIIDVDEPDNVPDEVLLVMGSDAPHQSSRPEQPGRGHYLLANTTGRRIGNSLGKLASAKKWGEIRGANGVIIAAPTKHSEGGCYRWIRTGPVPPIPDYLAEALPESSTPEDTATDAQVEHFLNTHTEAIKPEALGGLVNELRKKLAGGQSCHMSTLGILTDAMQEAAAGFYDARTATRELWPPYVQTVTTGTSTGRVLTKTEAKHSFKGIVAWAVGQAEPNASRARERVNAKYRDSVIEIMSDEISTPPTGVLEKLEGDFWTRRESHRLIFNAALSKMCSPWAVLACVTARTLALIPPSVTLPPVIGGIGSLNWFGAIVAKSGGGKGAANAVAAALVPGAVYTRGAGSGEGMVEAYDRRLEPQDHVTAILFSVDEVDSLASLQARSGQTTMSVIRSGFSGETLGFSYRNRSKEIVEAHSYRMTMIVSVQPERAAGLFDDAGGGTPQRFMWFPGRDWRIKAATAPPWPANGSGLPRQLPDIDIKNLPHTGMGIPDEARQLILQAREESMNGNDNALNGHALFCREKFAYALALLDGRTVMNSEDWELSGRAADVSDWCRLRAQTTLEESRRAAAIERGQLRGVEYYESDITKAVAARDDLLRILTWAVGKLNRADGRRMTKRKLTHDASSRDRAKLTEAMISGVESGLIKADGAEWVLL